MPSKRSGRQAVANGIVTSVGVSDAEAAQLTMRAGRNRR
jgi:hypothetical protein